jgi:hypothetical protein
MTLTMRKRRQHLKGQQRSTKRLDHIIFSVLVVLFSFSCDQADSNTLSPWRLSEWVIGQTLNSNQDIDVDDFSTHLSAKALKQLKSLRKMSLSDENLGLLSLNKNHLDGWSGFFAYKKNDWPLLLQFELQEQKLGTKSYWQISAFPFFDAYQKLAHLTDQSSDSSPISQGHLPWIQRASNWHGGLSGRDVRGRPLSSVVIAWLPPLAFVDGIPLLGIANRSKLSKKLSQAFEQRRRLADRSQASYTPHVSLALPAGAPAHQVMALMAWVEGVGAEQVSLVVQSDQGPAIVYLNSRSEGITLMNPQRLLHAQLEEDQSQLYVQRTDQAKSELIKGELSISSKHGEDRLSLDRSSRTFHEIIERVRVKGELSGLVIHLREGSKVSHLAQLIDICRQVDPTLPITLAPRSTSQEKVER